MRKQAQNALLIDSSALLAAFRDEPGAKEVRNIMEASPEGSLYMHAVNACEVAYNLLKFGFVEFVAYKMAVPNRVKILECMPPRIWTRAASLKMLHKNLSLGDCIAVAQAEEIHADILTGDRGFLRVETFIGIKLFR